MLSSLGGTTQLDASREAHLYMKRKGALGISNLILMNGGMADMIRIILSSAEDAKKVQKSCGPSHLRARIVLTSRIVPRVLTMEIGGICCHAHQDRR